MGDFTLAFKNINDLTTKKMETLIKKSVFDLTSAIISNTPVDTGRARANWQVSFNKPIEDKLDTLDKSGNVTISKANDKILNNKVPTTYYITNNLPYIMRLEYGWSKQSPAGMVRINLLKFNQILKGNIKW